MVASRPAPRPSPTINGYEVGVSFSRGVTRIELAWMLGQDRTAAGDMSLRDADAYARRILAVVEAAEIQGNSTLGMKPIASGAEEIDGVLHNEDVDSLVAASSVKAPQEIVVPYLMRTPAAPHIVAAMENVKMDVQHIASCYQQAQQLADVVLVEGVGGFCVPLDDETKLWSDSKEIYELKEENNTTTLTVKIDTLEDYVGFFSEKLPKAIELVKNLSEN